VGITILFIAVILFVCVLSVFLWRFYNKPLDVGTGEHLNNLPIERMAGTFIVDVDNPKELVGDAYFVFVAKVISQDGYVSKHVNLQETEPGEVEDSGLPYTNYSVNVIENMKGKLVLNTTIPLQKFGGLNEAGDAYVLFENDELPVVGETYIFVAYAENDGSIIVSGPNSNQKVAAAKDIKKMKSNTEIDKLEQVKIMKDAVKDQIEVRERERFKSIYEEDD
jgi:hypothetical protein